MKKATPSPDRKTFSKVWQLVKKIPPGKVTTYGRVAQVLEIKDARVVGWALHANRDPTVPCHRVVNREGKLAENYAFGGWRAQRRRLMKEGVKFVDLRRVDPSAVITLKR